MDLAHRLRFKKSKCYSTEVIRVLIHQSMASLFYLYKPCSWDFLRNYNGIGRWYGNIIGSRNNQRGIGYSWEQVACAFPIGYCLKLEKSTTLTFSLTVSDSFGQISKPNDVTITVKNSGSILSSTKPSVN